MDGPVVILNSAVHSDGCFTHGERLMIDMNVVPVNTPLEFTVLIED